MEQIQRLRTEKDQIFQPVKKDTDNLQAMMNTVGERTLSLKINNKRYWKQWEITKACKLLDINKEDIVSYFFTLKVQ